MVKTMSNQCVFVKWCEDRECGRSAMSRLYERQGRPGRRRQAVSRQASQPGLSVHKSEAHRSPRCHLLGHRCRHTTGRSSGHEQMQNGSHEPDVGLS